MGRIELKDSYYEDEIREGFYIPACVKQAWGAEITILNEIDRVCEELNIKYFADWGSFLGALRHGGFVPWDDDLDICMLRDDYTKFCNEGISRLPKGYDVYNLERRESHEQFLANVVNTVRISFEPEHLRTFHGFPYIACVDIFVIDYMSPDDEKQELMKNQAKYVLKLADDVRNGKLGGKELKDKLRKLKQDIGIEIPLNISDSKARQLLDVKAQELFASFDKEDAKEIVQMMPWGLNGTNIMPKYYYSKSVEIPFETGTIPVPLVYNDALKRHYGDYMRLHKNAGAHEYPYFEKSKRDLLSVLDFELPSYKVDTEEIIKAYSQKRCSVNDNTYRSIVGECLGELNRISDCIYCNINELLKGDATGDINELIQCLADAHQLAIDLGTYMETVKGEGYELVSYLESYCEDIYNISVRFNEKLENDNGKQCQDIDKEIENLSNHVSATIRELTDKYNARREVLFLTWKSSHFNTIKDLYYEAVADENTDVYLIQIPYYYKDYNYRLINMQYDISGYPEDVAVAHYDSYDYAIHHPDTIYFQNPYDEYNEAISLPPFFYSNKLLDYTDELVYIPWFEIKDFSKDDYCEYTNMRNYCTVPGVINADRIILSSDKLKEVYVEKLCDFAGEETRYIWKEKIQVINELNLSKPKDEIKDCHEKKILVYYPDFSDILKYREEAVEKIDSVIKTFRDNSERLSFLWVKNPLISSELKNCDEELYENYLELLKKELNGIDVEFVELDYRNGASDSKPDNLTSDSIANPQTRIMTVNELVETGSAYYGDAGYIAHMFRNAGKPVMIQNYEIFD